MQTARIFNNGNSQAVRLPKEFRFDEDEVVIKKIGDMVILLPKKYKVETLLGMLKEIGPMELEREQPKEQQEIDLGSLGSFPSSSFQSNEARASISGFPIWRLGTSAGELQIPSRLSSMGRAAVRNP
jgi:antitoxin VapB